MAAHDGSIRIDTKIDASGVNAGTQQVGKAIEKNVAKPTQALTKTFGNILSLVKTLGKALIAAFIGGSIINGIRSVLQTFDFMASFKDKLQPLSDAINTLKGTFANLIATALIPLIPYLVSAVEWLTRMLQVTAQLVAAFFGLKQTAGNIMTKAASEAKKAAKDAKGALAAFDQINVLAQKQQENAPEGPTASPAPFQVPDDLFNKVQELKNKAKELIDTITNSQPWQRTIEFLKSEWESIVRGWQRTVAFIKSEWATIKPFLIRLWEFIKADFALLGEVMQRAWARTVEFLKGEWETLKNFGANTWEFIKADFTALADFFSAAWQNIVEFMQSEWQSILDIATSVLDAITATWSNIADWFRVHVTEPISNFFRNLWTSVSETGRGVIAKLQGAWSAIATWFRTNVFAPIANGFGSMFTDIKIGFEAAFNGIKSFIRGVINNIIDYINAMIEGIVFGINTVIGAANAVSELVGAPEISSVTAPKIPRLATGAVIPPNSQFLAVLGDQKSGRNIEAPEGLIRQLLREEMGNIRAEIQLEFTGSMGQLVRQLQPHIKKENVRIGKTLLSSGTVK